MQVITMYTIHIPMLSTLTHHTTTKAPRTQIDDYKLC